MVAWPRDLSGMDAPPCVRLGRCSLVTRLISGNPLCGNSHVRRPQCGDAGLFHGGPGRVTHQLQRAGINAPGMRDITASSTGWSSSGGRRQLHWIAQTASEMSDVFQNIRILTPLEPWPSTRDADRPLGTKAAPTRPATGLKCIRDTASKSAWERTCRRYEPRGEGLGRRFTWPASTT